MENIKMDAYQRLQQLEFLICHDDTMDDFNQCYSEFLDDVRQTGDKSFLREARELLFRQFMYLVRRRGEEAAMAEVLQ